MRLFQEIARELGGELSAVSYIVCEERGAYFEDVRAVEKLSAEEVVLRLKRGRAIVRGQGLVVEKYERGDLSLRGKVFAVSREGV